MDTRVNGQKDDPDDGRVREYLDLVASRDVRGARALVLSELATDDGGLVRVIEDLLVPAMAEVGARWYDGRWNPAQEHVACGITESALSAATVRSRSRRPPEDAPSAVLVCPPGEAHVLPARFAAELLVEAGADVIVLGLPVPDRDLASYLTETQPAALILSCTESLALPGVRSAIAAAHQSGFPALVGGAGLGDDARRAHALGADGWALRPEEAMVLLRAWREQPPVLATAVPESEEVVALQGLGGSFFDDVLATLQRHVAAVGSYGAREVEQARADLKLIVSSISCALLGGDDRLFADFVTWSRGLLDARGVTAIVLDETLAVIREALGDGFPVARSMIDGAFAA